MRISTLGIELGPYNSSTGRAGAMLFDHRLDRIFNEFGRPDDSGNPNKALQNEISFAFRAERGAQVTAPIDAFVQRVETDPSVGDAELHLFPLDNPSFMIVIDHVINVSVAAGDVIRAGQVYAAATGRAPNGNYYPYEIQTAQIDSDVSVSPWTYYDPATLGAAKASILQLTRDWESYKGNGSVYNESGWIDTGVILSSVDNPINRFATSGTAGADRLVGNNGIDFQYAGAGNDTMSGAAGNDLLYGGDGADIIYGNTGIDIVMGQGGDDRLFAGQGNDLVHGADGADTAYGNFGNDVVAGDAGNDVLYGGRDNDTLLGGAGDDVLLGGIGNDLLSGGSGADMLRPSAGNDTVDGFSFGEGDRIAISAADSYSIGTEAGGAAVIAFGGGGNLTLAGIVPQAITGDWFVTF